MHSFKVVENDGIRNGKVLGLEVHGQGLGKGVGDELRVEGEDII